MHGLHNYYNSVTYGDTVIHYTCRKIFIMTDSVNVVRSYNAVHDGMTLLYRIKTIMFFPVTECDINRLSSTHACSYRNICQRGDLTRTKS